jgi:hypothetical protein
MHLRTTHEDPRAGEESLLVPVVFHDGMQVQEKRYRQGSQVPKRLK